MGSSEEMGSPEEMDSSASIGSSVSMDSQSMDSQNMDSQSITVTITDTAGSCVAGSPGKTTVVAVPPGQTISEILSETGIALDAPCGRTGRCGKCRVLLNGQPVLACQSRVYTCADIVIPDQLTTGHNTGHNTGLNPSGMVVEQSVQSSSVVSTVVDTDSPDDPLAVAVDLGTTTIAVSLMNMRTGKRIAGCGELNRQVEFGGDVISRIQYEQVHGPAGLEKLHGTIVHQLESMILAVCQSAVVERGRVREVYIAGNTTMESLAAGVSVLSLGAFPFTSPMGCTFLHQSGSELGFEQLPAQTQVWLMPVISGFVGGDIVGGIQQVLRLTEHETPCVGTWLLIDLGTNGEIVLSHEGKRISCATAAGPAFEGAGISCGMRAVPGAIEHVRSEHVRSEVARSEVARSEVARSETSAEYSDSVTNCSDSVTKHSDTVFNCQTIGGERAIGLCGSGLMDLIAELLRCGWITTKGRLNIPPLDTGFLPCPVTLTQADVRQVQLAVGAIRSGIEILLRREGLGPEHIDRLFIAGGFGKHLRTDSVQAIGLIPAGIPENRIRYLGNTSLASAECLSGSNREQTQDLMNMMTEIAQTTHFLNLAEDPMFADTFARAMRFPTG